VIDAVGSAVEETVGRILDLVVGLVCVQGIGMPIQRR